MSFVPALSTSNSLPAPAAAAPLASSQQASVENILTGISSLTLSSDAGTLAQRTSSSTSSTGAAGEAASYEAAVAASALSAGGASSSRAGVAGAAVAGAASSSSAPSSGAAVAGAAGTGAPLIRILNITGVNAHIYSFLSLHDVCKSEGINKATRGVLKEITVTAQLSSMKRISLKQISEYQKARGLASSDLDGVLKCCSALTSIDLSDGSISILDALTVLLPKYPKVTEINLTDCGLMDSYVIALSANCRGLTAINVDACLYLTDASITALAENCPGLTNVSLYYCQDVTDAAINTLSLHCQGLKQINLASCFSLTDAGITALSANCGGLTEINLSCCRITDAAVIALAENCRGLTRINLYGCRITGAAVTALAANCPGLTHMDLRGCNLITAATIAELTAMYPNLDIRR